MSNKKIIKGSQIDENQIENKHIKSDAVTESKISNSAVTLNKLAADSVNNSKIIDVSGSKIDDGTVAEAKLTSALQTKIDNASSSNIGIGDVLELFSYSSSIKFSESTSDLYKNATDTNNFWHPSYSLAGFSSSTQPIGYNDSDVSTTITNTTNKQFYFAKDLIITSSQLSNVYGLYFNFRCDFKGIIWIGGNEVFNNLDSGDDATQYTSKSGHKIVTISGAQDYITASSSNRIAILYKQTSGQSSLDFGVSFGSVVGGTEVVGLESFGFQFDMDNVGQGSSYRKLTSSEYSNLSNIPSSAEKVFLTNTKSSSDSKGGLVFATDLTSFVASSTLAASGGAGLVGVDDSEFGFTASTVQAAFVGLLSNITSNISFDNTKPNLPGLGSTPTIQQGINKLAYASNIHIDGTHFSGVISPPNLYIQNALNKLRYAENISFDSSGLGLSGSPDNVQKLGEKLSNPDNISYDYSKFSSSNVGGILKELRNLFDDASNVKYSGDASGSNVKQALDNLANSVSNEMYQYDGTTAFQQVRTGFASLGETIPSDMNIVEYPMSVPLDYLMSAIKSISELGNPHSVYCNAYSVGTGEVAENVSNDYFIPLGSTWAEIDIHSVNDASNEYWEDINAIYNNNTEVMDITHKLSGSSGVNMELVEDSSEYDTSAHAPEDWIVSNFVLKKSASSIIVAGDVEENHSMKIKVRFGP